MNQKIDIEFEQLRYSVKTVFYDIFEKSLFIILYYLQIWFS